jgi:hypothetical protein
MVGLWSVWCRSGDDSRRNGLLTLVSIVAVVAGVIAGAAGSASGAALSPQLRFARFLGSELPNNGSMAEVVVSCAGSPGTRCSGVLQLLPRGAAAQRLVGSGPIASRSIRNAYAGQEDAIVLRLGERSREALARGNVLRLAVVLRQVGGRSVARNLVAAKERAIVGHRRPNSVVRHIVRRLSGRSATSAAAATTVDYSWSWHIPVRHFLVLPDFRCPSSAPYVAGSTNTRTYSPRRAPRPIAGPRVWARIGMLRAAAKSGTGYASFTTPHLTNHRGVRMMTGWPEGSWTTNNAWAPVLFEDGKFELKVTCTSSDALDDVAWVGEDVKQTSAEVTFPTAAVFPWAKSTPHQS